MNRQQALFIEDKRLTALNSYNVLDTLPEKDFDAITRLASYICKAPIALISFIDAERQWVKSAVGTNALQIPRADSFCTFTILDNKILEISDVLESEIFRQNPFVINDPQIRFYAGAPLIDPDGHRLPSGTGIPSDGASQATDLLWADGRVPVFPGFGLYAQQLRHAALR